MIYFKTGDILIAKDDFFYEDVRPSKQAGHYIGVKVLTKGKKYEVVNTDNFVEDDEPFFEIINDMDDIDDYYYEGKIDYRNFFWTLNEVRELKLLELGI